MEVTESGVRVLVDRAGVDAGIVIVNPALGLEENFAVQRVLQACGERKNKEISQD